VTDFSNITESNLIAQELRNGLHGAVSNCLLCLLRAHSTHEETDFFPAVRPFDSEAVAAVMAEHREIKRRIYHIAKHCDELQAVSGHDQRVEAGDRLHAEASDLIALTLAHLNREESTLVPIMWERFTDQQLRDLRAQFYNSIPLAQFEEWMRWSLPALNVNELQVLLRGMRMDPPPNRFSAAIRVGEEVVDSHRWNVIMNQLGGAERVRHRTDVP
jgi:hypothetical protein